MCQHIIDLEDISTTVLSMQSPVTCMATCRSCTALCSPTLRTAREERGQQGHHEHEMCEQSLSRAYKADVCVLGVEN